MPELFPDLVTDVLVRLPVKSLVRFRCISNPICSQIDSPDFTKLHLNRSTHSNPHRSIIIPHGVGFKLYSLNPHSRAQDDQILNPFVTQDGIAVVFGSCNGLLCLYDSREQIVIWNPATRKHLNLPSSPLSLSCDLNFFQDLCHFSYGFGYDSHHDDYKLLVVDIDSSHSDCKCRVFVYSIKLNLWRPVSGWFFRYVHARMVGIFVSGALHFIAVDLAAAGEEECHSRELPPPPQCSHFIILGVLEGCHSVTSYLDDDSVTIWVMKDYGVMESWTELLSVHIDELSSRDALYIKPLAISNDGDEVMLQDNNSNLLRYDLKMKKLVSFRLPVRPFSRDCAVFTESIVNSMPISTPDDNLDTEVLTSD